MTATQTTTREWLTTAREMKRRSDEQVAWLRGAALHAPDNEVPKLNDLLFDAQKINSQLADILLDLADGLLTDNERLTSMAAHPAGKGRCRCTPGLRSV